MRRWMFAAIVACGTAISTPNTAMAQRADNTPAAPQRRFPMRVIDTPYYTLHTDVNDAEARETDMRMTRMFEEYQRRTAGFAGQVKGKFPLYLFRNQSDYYAAGGPPKSDGVYIESAEGKRLMAIAGEIAEDSTWHILQHEGFHQFTAATMQFGLPIWAEEGLAEYFGEALWTGDGFVSGLIPPDRMKDVQKGIKGGQFKPFKTIMGLTSHEWITNLEISNYDEAWAMIHFLANADNGKYQGPLLQYMQQVSRGTTSQKAWDGVFGQDVAGFQSKFASWWMNLPENPSRPAYLRALVQTETSFLGRAILMKRTFSDPVAFFKEYRPPAFGINRDLWLPPTLFATFGEIAPLAGKWRFEGTPLPKLILQLEDGTQFSGTYMLANGKVDKVSVIVTPPAAH